MLEFFSALFKRENSGATAKERLRLVLLSDHLSLAPDVIDALKADLLAVISRYMEIDASSADVTFEQRDKEVAMLASIPVRSLRDRHSGGAPQGGSGGVVVPLVRENAAPSDERRAPAYDATAAQPPASPSVSTAAEPAPPAASGTTPASAAAAAQAVPPATSPAAATPTSPGRDDVADLAQAQAGEEAVPAQAVAKPASRRRRRRPAQQATNAQTQVSLPNSAQA